MNLSIYKGNLQGDRTRANEEVAGTELKIRLAMGSDLLRVAEINVASWRAAYKNIIPDEGLESLSVEKIAKAYQEYLKTPGACMYLLEEHEIVAGYVHLCSNRDGDKDASKVGEIAAIRGVEVTEVRYCCLI